MKRTIVAGVLVAVALALTLALTFRVLSAQLGGDVRGIVEVEAQ